MGTKKFDRFFFIDLENVHRDGLKGVEDLTEKDCVRIYYSNPMENMTLDLHLQITRSPANFEYVRVEIPIKNAADCMILFDIKEIAAKHKKASFIIISNDTDFDRPIHKFTTQGINVKKLLEINGKDSAKKEEKIREFINEHFKDIDISDDREENIEKTVQAVLKAKTKSQINYSLLKIYDSQSVKLIFNELKPLMKDLPGK